MNNTHNQTQHAEPVRELEQEESPRRAAVGPGSATSLSAADPSAPRRLGPAPVGTPPLQR